MEWKQLSESPLKRPGRYRKIVQRIYELPDGSRAEFEIKAEEPNATILALTPDNEVILAKQYRPGPGKVLAELPGGVIDAGEAPETAAERELLEETGHRGKLVKVGQSYLSPYSTAICHTFVATDCVKVQEPQHEATEFIEVVIMPLAAFRQYLRTGDLTGGDSAYLGLDYLKLL